MTRVLVTESRHREPVKLGIALLGLSHTAEDRDVLKILEYAEEALPLDDIASELATWP